MQTSNHSDESVSNQTSNNESSNSMSPLEAVRKLVQRLAPIDMSTSDLQTCVLFTLLKSNNFSIGETKRQLSESRNAILESLVLPDFDCNRDLNRKTCDSTVPDKSDPMAECLPPKLYPIEGKAKKSISSRGSHGVLTPPPNIQSCKAIDLNLKVRQQKRKLKHLISDSPKVLKDRSTSTQTSIDSEAEVKAKQKKSLKQCFNQTSTQSSSSLVKETIPLIATTNRPVQSVRPLNPNPESSNSFTTDSNRLPNDSTTGTLSSNSVPIVCEPSVANRPKSDTNDSQKCSNKSQNCLPSNAVKDNGIKTCLEPFVWTSTRKLTQNRIKLIKRSTDKIDNNSVNKIFQTCAPNENNFTKNKSLKNSDESNGSPNNRITAQIITTEAALAALSTICDSNSSLNTSLIESELSDVALNPSKSKSNKLTEIKPQIAVKTKNDLKPLSQKQKIGTSFSDQFKLFLNTSKSSSNSEPNLEINSPEVKKVTEITID